MDALPPTITPAPPEGERDGELLTDATVTALAPGDVDALAGGPGDTVTVAVSAADDGATGDEMLMVGDGVKEDDDVADDDDDAPADLDTEMDAVFVDDALDDALLLLLTETELDRDADAGLLLLTDDVAERDGVADAAGFDMDGDGDGDAPLAGLEALGVGVRERPNCSLRAPPFVRAWACNVTVTGDDGKSCWPSASVGSARAQERKSLDSSA